MIEATARQAGTRTYLEFSPQMLDGFICVKEANGHTASFKRDNSQEWSEEQKREQEARKLERQRKNEERRQQRREQEMPAESLDYWYRKLLGELGLKEGDRIRLIERTYTDKEIQVLGFKSVEPRQRLNGNYPSNLPGILGGFGGKILNVHNHAILCPIFNAYGLIVGCQFRLNEVEKGEGRYRWLSSATKKNPNGATPHIKGELPIGVYYDHEVSNSIGLVESTTIKPSLAQLRLGGIFLGASGGLFSSSPETTLEALSKYKDIKSLTIYPDAGDVANSKVMHRWRNQIEFFEKSGYTIQVAWWGQFTKEHCDIDELEDLSVIEIITTQKFLSFGLATCISTASPKEDDWKFSAWLKKRQFTADIKVSHQEFTFSEEMLVQAVVAVKSGLGTGKTKALIEMIKSDNFNGRGSVIIGYRNNLLLQTGGRALSAGVEIYHIHMDDNGKLMMTQNLPFK